VADHDALSTPLSSLVAAPLGAALHPGALLRGTRVDVAQALFEQSPFSTVLYDSGRWERIPLDAPPGTAAGDARAAMPGMPPAENSSSVIWKGL
jgi:hypothetical protein